MSISTPSAATSATSPRSRRRLTAAIAAALGTVVVGSALGLASPASATEFEPKAELSVLNSCKDGVYHYDIGLYNLQGTDWAHFTVTVENTNETNGVSTHDVPAFGLEWLSFTVPEGVTASFHIVSASNAVKPIDFLATPRPDCIPDPVTNVQVACAEDGTATVLYDWVNTSYTTAHFSLTLGGASVGESDIAWSDHEKSLSVPVAEASHVLAAITVDGAPGAAVDTVVDCVPETTIDTTPETTPDTTPATTPEQTVDSTPVTTVPMVMIPVETSTTSAESSIVAQQPPADVELPVTGQSSNELALFAIGTLVAGLALVCCARRAT